MATRNVPTIELCNERSQFGEVTFVGSKTAVVTFLTAFVTVPKVFFSALSKPAGEVMWITGKSVTEFTLNSDKNLTASFDWSAETSL